MSELDNLISGLNNINHDANGASDAELDFNFSFSESLLDDADLEADPYAGSDLPAFSMPGDFDLGLPSPDAGDAFPSPKSDNGLPSLKASDAFPSPKAGDAFPSPQINAGLPAPKMNMGRPMPSTGSNAGLPSVKKSDAFPSPKINGGLPSPKINSGLPSPKINSGLPSPKGTTEDGKTGTLCGVGVPWLKQSQTNAGVKSNPGVQGTMCGFPVPKTDEAAHFQAQNDVPVFNDNAFALDMGGEDVGSPKSLGDSALGVLNNIQAPVLKMEHQQPTGAFNQQHDFDNDSGLPVMDDPLNLVNNQFSPSNAGAPYNQPAFAQPAFNAPAQPAFNAPVTPAFSAPVPPAFNAPAAPAAPAFNAPAAPAFNAPAQSNDILNLFGDQDLMGGQEPQPFEVPVMPAEPAPVPPPSFDLGANAPAGQINTPAAAQGQVPLMTAAPAAPAAPVMNVPEIPGGDIREISEEDEVAEGELVFDLNSIKSDKTKTHKIDATNANKVTTSKSSKTRKILIAAILVLGISMLAIAALSSLIFNEAHVDESELAPLPEAEVINLDWNIVKYDRQAGYNMFYKRAIDKLGDNNLSESERSDVQGQILVAMTLAMTRFEQNFSPMIERLDNSIDTISENCSTSWCSIGLWSWGLLRERKDLVEKFEPQIAEGDSSIKNVVQLAVNYSKWKPETEGFKGMIEHGNKLLKSVSNEALQWPLVAWIVASIDRELGRFDDAMKILNTMHSDDEKHFYSAAALLEAEILLATDKIDEAIKVIESVESSQYADAVDKIRAEQLGFLARSSKLLNSDFEDAVSQYLSKNINSPENIKNAVQTCLYANRSDVCKKTFSYAVEKNSNNPQLIDGYLQLMFAKLGYVKLIRPDTNYPKVVLREADELVERVIKLDQNNNDFWKHRAFVSYAMQDYEATGNALDEIERGRKMVWIGAFLRDLMQYKGANEEKRQSLRESLAQYMDQVYMAEDVVALAIALDYVGDQEMAKALVARAAALHPEQTMVLNAYFDLAVVLKDREVVESIQKQLEARHAFDYEHEYIMARLFDELGDTTGALEKMLSLVERSKNEPNPSFQSYTGMLFFKQNQCDSALPYLEQALELSGNNDPEAHYYKGRCLHKSGMFEAALNEFNEAANQDEANRIYELWVGQAYAGLGRDNEALKAFSSVIDDYETKNKTGSKNVDSSVAAEAYYFRAELRKYQNRKKETKADYMTAMGLLPEEVKYHRGYAIFFFESGDLKDCIETVDRAEYLAGGKIDPVLYYVRGVSKLNLNHRKEALVDLEKARDGGFGEFTDSGIIGVRDASEVYERLGYLYRDLGRREEARNSIKKFLQLSTTLSPSDRKQVMAELERI